MTKAADLFRLARPLSRKTLIGLTRKFRQVVPPAWAEEKGPERVFSVLDRLVPTSKVLQPGFLEQHAAWMDEALKSEGRTFRLRGAVPEGRLEEDGEFLYAPSLKRCYTLVWRWLPVLIAGERDLRIPTLDVQDCNEILAVLRRELSLQNTTYLDLYPEWVEPREAGALFEKDRRLLRSMDSSDYRFKPWEGVPT